MPTLDYLTGWNHRVSGTSGIVTDELGAATIGLGSISTSTVRRVGGTSLNIAPSAAAQGWGRRTATASSEWCGVVYVNFATLPAADVAVFCLEINGVNTCGLAFDIASGQLKLFQSTNAGTSFSVAGTPGGPVLVTGTWYRLETKTVTSANPWSVNGQVAVGDGAATALSAIAPAIAAETSQQRIILGMDTGTATFSAFFTDLATSATAGDYPIGPLSMYGYSPSGVGTHNLDASTSAYFFKEVAAVDSALTTVESTSYQTIDDMPVDQDIDAIWVGTTTGAPATPAFRSAGTTTFSANNVTNIALTPGTPGTRSVGDLLVLVAACSSNANTVTTPAGWNLVSGFPKASGTSVGGKIYVFTRIADGSATDVPAVTFGSMTTGTSGTPGAVVILVYQNGTETLDGALPTLTDTTATTTTTIPAFTTGTNNSMVVGIAMKMQDLAQTSTVATFTERVDSSTTNAIGWVLEVSDKVQATLGGSGTAAVTWSSSTSGRTLAISLGFKSSLAVVQPTATWYAEYNFADESTLTSGPVAVRAIAAQNQDTSDASTWVAKLFDSAQGTNTEDVSNSSISLGAKTFVGKTFTQRPNTGGAWTVAALNGVTLRFGLTAAATGHPRIEAAILEAAFTPAVVAADTDHGVPFQFDPIPFMGR